MAVDIYAITSSTTSGVAPYNRNMICRAANNDLYVVYGEKVSGRNKVILRKSTDNGQNWSDVSTAGGLTQTAPTTEDTVTVVIGYATHADRIYFCPSLDRITYKA